MTTQAAHYQIMPDMTDEQYQELKEDMRHKGMIQPLVFDQHDNLIDGHHRQRAFFELIEEGVDLDMYEKVVINFNSELDKLAYVLSLNMKRRHLTVEQRQELTRKLRLPPHALTITQIAQIMNVSVATVSRDLGEALSEEDKQTLANMSTTGADGKQRTMMQAEKTYLTGDKLLRQFNAQANADTKTAEAKTDQLDDLQAKWKVEPDQVWLIPSKAAGGSTHRLICGDTLKSNTWNDLFHDRSARLVVTSPPYNQKLDAFKASGMQLENSAFIERMASSYEDSKPEKEYQEEQLLMFSFADEFTTDDASFMYNHKHRYREMQVLSPMEWIRNSEWLLRQEIVWNRGSSITMNARMFIPADERIYWLFKGKAFHFTDTPEVKAWSSVWNIGAHNEYKVSAPFPNEIASRCIFGCSERGDIVLDPYAGTGTVLAEAERCGRTGYGIERNPAYCAVILDRLSRMGLEPKLER